MPEDLKDFDPTLTGSPRRRRIRFYATSGRPDEPVWGAMAAGEPGELGEWAKHMKSGGMTRVLGLFTAEDAGARLRPARQRATSRSWSPPARLRRRMSA